MTTAWQLRDQQARLLQGRYSAALNLLEPAKGLHAIDDAEFAEAELLGLEIPCRHAAVDASTGKPPAVIEAHVRGADLVAVFREAPQWPVRVDVLWRSAAAAPVGALPAFELIVSVGTELLESRPELTVRTALVADEVLRLADAGASRFQPTSPHRSPWLGPGDGPGCLLFRREGNQTSYAEMIHPADFHRDQLGVGDNSRVELRHQLFPQPLEKGVILRAWLRGLFCRRGDDTAIVAHAYREFAAMDPPLGT